MKVEKEMWELPHATIIVWNIETDSRINTLPQKAQLIYHSQIGYTFYDCSFSCDDNYDEQGLEDLHERVNKAIELMKEHKEGMKE